ncbi:Glycosyl transferase family 2 [Microbacterium sp. cf046]|uniref:glycosyltransferase family 2 protein n=1 Tax=Microbacterium sp. cf046 TaxID=1761803 RepID=UPI0008F385C9|nr:glycosyltransferase family 2 protein [Microbacterium sp. cf046]SFS08408.1 Glycosyl transferase family 2 [Microbacterium sp. cf046]
MSSPAAVTVIVPGFDVAPYAAEALDSLRRQSLRDWVAILIDDGSTDATPGVFADAAESDPRFRVVRHRERAGLGAARNTGLDLVDTPFLGFLDADDVLTPTALERMVGVLDESGSDFAVGAYVRLRPDGAGGYTVGVVQPWVAASTAPERRGTTIDEHPEATGNIVAWSKVSRTEFWHRAGLRFPEGRLYEDQVVAQQMYARARRFDTVPDVVAHWRIRADGSSITQREAQLDVLRDCLEAMDAGLEVLQAGGHPVAAQARIGQMLRMDIPRLADIARLHPDAAYRRALGAFARDLWDHAGTARTTLDPASATAVAAARLW